MAGVLVYLERAIAPPEPLPHGLVPRPHGTAPVGWAGADLVASVGPGEGVWLGFQAVDRQQPVTVRVRLDEPDPCDAVTGRTWRTELSEDPPNRLVVPPDSRLVGVPRPDGVHLFAPPARLRVVVVDPPVSAAVRLVGPAEFERLTGRRPPPLDPDAAYSGWRAP